MPQAVVPEIAAQPQRLRAPLSPMQQQLWFQQQQLPGRLDNLLPSAHHLRGPLDQAALQAAWGCVVERQACLRTRFEDLDGQPVQIVEPAARLSWGEVQDLSGLDDASRKLALQTGVNALMATPLPLHVAPLARVALFRLADHEHVLVVVVHHLVWDSVSFNLLCAELGQAYAGLAGGQPRSAVMQALPQLPLSALDHAAWQAQTFNEHANAAQVAHWRERFTPLPEGLDLPTDRPRPARMSGRGHTVAFEVPAATVTRVKALAMRWGATPCALFLAAYAAVLYRLSGQNDLVIATPVNRRDRAALAPLMGLLSNTLALRLATEGTQSFAALVQHTSRLVREATAAPDVQLTGLVRALGLPHDASRLALYQALFAYQDARGQALPWGVLQQTPLQQHALGAAQDLGLWLVEQPAGLAGGLAYNADIFEPATAERLAERYLVLLNAALAAPDTTLATLPWASAHDLKALAQWNAAPQVDYPRQANVRQMLFERGQADPQALAVIAGELRWTHAELHAQAWRIAHALRARGIGRGRLVGLCVNRHAPMVAALLGILASGACYVPLDPGFPTERLALMVDDAGLAVVLAERDTVHRLPSACSVLQLEDIDPAALSTPLPPDAQWDARPDDAAYVIYTSGSTGRPKGVALTQRAVVNFLCSMLVEPGLALNDRLLAVTTLSFDISLLEMLVPPIVGAATIVASREQALDPEALRALLEQHQATAMQATPTSWRMLVDTGWAGHPGFTAITGGEPLAPDLAQQLLDRCGALWNGYGPSETTVYSTMCQVTSSVGIRIGRPVANTTVWVLDECSQLCPVGVPGELCIGGEGVGIGYLNRPELTAEKFIADPFHQGQRLYRTGDRGRWRNDGTLEHLGRLDFQVKIRGVRIELGEIEAALQQSPGIAQSVVVAHEDSPGDKRLVAYVVMQAGLALGAAGQTALRERLRRSLPSYMLPQQFVALDAMPLLPNGKINRKALPAPLAVVRSELLTPHDAPQNDTERLLCELFAQILEVDRVGRSDHFFELGGHSVLAARLSMQATQRTGTHLPIHAVFAHPTPQTLAAVLSQPAATAVPALEAQPQRLRFALSNMQQRLWFQEQLIPGRLDNLLPSAHRLRGALNETALQAAWHCVLERQAALRTRFEDVDGQPMQLIEPAATHAMLAMLKPGAAQDLSGLDEASRMAALHQGIDALMATPLPLHTAPLARVALYRLAPDDHVLVFVIHHLVWDGVSFDLLCAELGQAYAHFASGAQRPAVMQALPPLPLSAPDHAAWHAQVFGPEGLAGPAQVAHWRQRFTPLPEGLDLPADRPRPARMTGRGQTVAFHVPTATVLGVRRLASQLGTTPYAVLLATYATLLYRLSGQDDLVIATPVNRRDQADLLPLMGFLVSTLPLRVRADAAQPFSALVQHTSQVVREAMAAPDVPLDGLVRALGLPLDASGSQLYQALFAHQDMREQARQWGQGAGMLRHELLPQHARGAAQDLGLWLLEHPSDSGAAMTGGLAYNADIFKPQTAALLAERYLALLHAAVSAPDTSVATLPFASAHDQQALQQWNSTQRQLPPNARIERWISQQAGRTPDRAAVAIGSMRMTYGQLEQAANRFAHTLLARGVGPGDLVGVCLSRNEHLLPALLGVLKTGAAYVPLDPHFPLERLHYMAQDAALKLVVTEAAHADKCGLPRAAQLRVDDDAAELQATRTDPPQAPDSGDAPAYVIYTSGSTGQPKGVVVPHSAVCNLLASMREAPGLTSDDRLLAVTTLSFDIAVFELFLPLTVGASLVLASRDDAMDAQALVRLLIEHRITALQATPTTWHMLLDAHWQAPPGFKALSGGETLTPALAKALLAQRIELWNMYGPTETTVWSTVARITDADQPIPIGVPIANTAVWVLDERGHLCPVGVPGELCIGGDGVALGYWNRAELTAEKFVADPFDPGRRLYRTGDRGRWRHEGTLEHLGRLDFQVKLRGFRIELGEIEAVLQQSPGVAQCVVMAREDTPGDKRLAAYVVMRAGQSLNEPGLREGLRRQLPSYMLPQQLVALDALPLLPNGKINRKALPAPVASVGALADDAAPEPPATPTEQAVAQVWQALLQLPSVNMTADFFALGGHSLMAVRLMALLASRVPALQGQRLPLTLLLEAPTIRSLARHIDAQRTVSGVVTLRDGSNTRPPLFLVHDGDGETLLYRHLALALSPGHAVYGLQPLAGQGVGMLHTRIPQMAAHYVDNLRKVQPEGPYLIAGLCAGGLIASEMVLQLHQTGQQVAFLGVLDAGDVGARMSTTAYWKKSLQRFVKGVKGSDESPTFERMVAGLRTAVSKTQNLLAYELQSRQQGVQKDKVFRELQSCLDTGQAPPEQAQALLVREIYLGARAQYAPQGPVPCVTLFRATQGDGSSADEPAAEYYVDADFGWAARVGDGLRIIDSPGGHVTMLQPPHVEVLAAQVGQAIDDALQASTLTPAPVPVPGSGASAATPG